ncbi:MULTISPECIES: DUF4365 domain-containing protein [unclassified Rhizobium]|uniref:DUF4365 domain-containing protein n=1 Tax=unclassified Rhizobium TaxID=2613769 RepID=UPI001FD96110|nr:MULTISPECIES: DUF4365 domain-containing protein [unclassified Rhizobium]MBP2460471.1 Mn-containing catalase [Rhizobium sp. PvP014]MBP2527868.1 Mn-containing catalase [Rhizobium sp. PvP099]
MAVAETSAYHSDMANNVTQNQIVGEIGETSAKLQFLKIGFQFDPRSRLEAGIDAIVEVMDHGKPLAKMIAVQVKTTESAKYPGEDDSGFHYLLKSEDLAYWRGATCRSSSSSIGGRTTPSTGRKSQGERSFRIDV